jgi:hypothetical protein
MGTDLLVGVEQHLVADAALVRAALELLQGGEHHHESALHVDHPGTAEAVVGQHRAALERIPGVVNGVVVSAEEQLHGRIGAHADAQDAGRRVVQWQMFNGGAGQPGKIGGQQGAHGLQAGEIMAAGVLVAPADEPIAEKIEIHGWRSRLKAIIPR